MNEDQLKGKWKQVKGEVQRKWGKLTDDHYNMIQGDKEKLIGKIQELYGVTKEEAEKEYTDWYRGL